MSGGFLGSILKPVNSILKPLKTLGGELTGSRAARQQAQAVQDQTEAQQRQYEKELQAAQNQNQLDASGDLGNVATITAGGSAQSADSDLSASTKKNRKQLISSTLGL